jgi:DNA mismatch endonuclease, patch repair protein
MTDVLTPEQRSYNMSQIRGKDTMPELLVRSMLHRMGYRFRLHRNDLPGRPDIVLPRHKAVIFVHGCFWHRHSGCRYTTNPKTNYKFWARKFQENMGRDNSNREQLIECGWKVVVVWECETRDAEVLHERVLTEFG